jgi:hypothetical protein
MAFSDLDDEMELTDLQEQSADANKQKAYLGVLGTVAQGLQNVPSSYEMLYNKKSERPDMQGMMSGIASTIENPMDREAKAMAYMKSKRENRAGAEQESILAGRKDPNSVQSKAAKMIAGKFGIDVTPEMSAHDIDQIMDSKRMMETQAQSSVNFENQKALGKINHGYDMQKLGSAQAADQKKAATIANSAKGQFDALPEDKKLTITELAKKNAFKQSIANQIDATMGQWDSLDDDQKVARGRQLLKTLNSTEGSDAVGAQEAAMLGSKLEFALGNLFNGQPLQVGRDLEGFKTQAMGTSKAIRDAVKSNQAMIDQSYGRSSAPLDEAAGAKTPRQYAREEIARRNAAKNTAGR